jgi:hypothetical protein
MRQKLKKIKFIKSIYDTLRITSIWLAAKQQRIDYKKLQEIIPDIEEQYTTTFLDNNYIKFKVRCQHTFQIYLARKYCGVGQYITDLGDSSGNHVLYLKYFFPRILTRSINVDKEAIDKIQKKGLEASKLSAEKFAKMGWYTDLLLMFQTLEHLENPVSFLKDLRKNCHIDNFIITIPYMRKSRIGLHHLRSVYHTSTQKNTSEDVHIFELSPKDWKLLFEYTGWKVKHEKIYYQYPRWIPIISFLLKKYWQKMDYEGFYGVVLK